MKIIHHTDSGMSGKTESLASKERNVNTKSVCRIQLIMFTVVLTVKSLFFTKAKKWFVSFVLSVIPT